MLKTVLVKCPWCQREFQVQIDAKYREAKAIPEPLWKYEGENTTCPKCGRSLFIWCQ